MTFPYDPVEADPFATDPFDSGSFDSDPFDSDPFDSVPGMPGSDMLDTPGVPEEPGDAPEVRFGSGGYSGSYDGIADCWFSNDGYVYAPDGTRIGAC